MAHFDSDLVARLRADDDGALRSLMEACFDDVARVAYHYLRSTDDASDVAQEVFIRLWERRHALEDGNLLHYLRRSARNGALKILERRTTATRFAEQVITEYEIASSSLGDAPQQRIHLAELSEAVRRALLALIPPRVREIAILYHEHGLEPREIADLLGIAVPTVYVQLRKATQQLQKALMDWRA